MKITGQISSSTLPLVFLFSLVTNSCGRPHSSDDAELQWVKSRTESTQYAFLEERDVQDEFVFGASIIKTKNFISSALNTTLPPRITKIITGRTPDNSLKMAVVAKESKQALMMFDLKRDAEGRVEVDFGSVGNDLSFNAGLDDAGALLTTSSRDWKWVSKAAPKVEKIQQDDDTIVVDLVHTIVAEKKNDFLSVLSNVFGFSKTKDIPMVLDPDKPSEVTIRVYLMRRSSVPKLTPSRTVSDGRSKNVGFFSSSMFSQDPSLPIQRFAVGQSSNDPETITFYLKDVPAEFEGVAKKGIESWNAALGSRATIKVLKAPESLDVGDPRFNVVKWYDGLTPEVQWAGVAKMLVDPETGAVFSGNLYLNGGTVLSSYKSIDKFTREVAGTLTLKMDGKIGQGGLVFEKGETPVIPYFTDVGVEDYATYMQGYYLSTIAHEAGHVFGLRHNFRGGNTLNPDGGAQSVMAYLPRHHRNREAGPGKYDISAIRWGYFGEEPKNLEFCTDEDVEKLYDCNRGTYGDPVKYTAKAMTDGAKVFSSLPIKIKGGKAFIFESMADQVSNMLKMVSLADQIPEADRESSKELLLTSYNFLKEIKPSSKLTAEEQTLAEENIKTLLEFVNKAEAEFKKPQAVAAQH